MPFVVGWTTVSAAIGGSWRQVEAAELFPDVSHDPWLSHFSSIPLTYASSEKGELVLTPALPIELHVTSQEAVRALLDHIILLASPLFAARLRRAIEEKASWVPSDTLSRDAVSILLSEPVFLMTPPIDSGMWNEDIAHDRLPTTAQVTGPLRKDGETIGLADVFLEFSALEYGFWASIETGRTRTICRGLYLKRIGSEFWIWQLFQDVPSGPDYCVGPFLLRFSAALRAFELETNEGLSRKALLAEPSLHKRVLVALTVIRELSEDPIPSPFPTATVDGNAGLVVSSQSGGKLYRAIDPRTRSTVYLHRRDVKAARIDVLSASEPWAELRAGDLGDGS